MLENMGLHAMWGHSSALDLQDDLNADDAPGDEDTPLNILLVNSGDPRHVIKTISQRRRHAKRPLHFYLYDKPVEVLARQALLLQVLHDWEIPIRQRCNTFLEIFGNSLVQERTAKYIHSKGAELVELICNNEGAMAGFVDVGHLKFKQRDELEQVFKSWSVDIPFEMTEMREARLRNMYGDRYDVSKNLIDWDYIEGIKKVDAAGIIHKKQYTHWRQTGVAYEFGDQEYTVANRTMASEAEGREKKRGAVMRKGYWQDLVISPYCSFGTDCHRSNQFANLLFEIQSKGTGVEQWRHNTVEIAVYNLLCFLWEVETGKEYEMTQIHEIYSGLSEVEKPKAEDPAEEIQMSGTTVEEDAGKPDADDGTRADEGEPSIFSGKPLTGGEKRKAARAAAADGLTAEEREHAAAVLRARTIVESLSDCKVFLMGGDTPLEELAKKAKYRGLFHRAHFSDNGAHLLGKAEITGAGGMLAPNATVTCDSAVNIWPLKKEEKAGFAGKILDMAKETGMAWRPQRSANPKVKKAAPHENPFLAAGVDGNLCDEVLAFTGNPTK
jgi:dynein assembly factor 3